MHTCLCVYICDTHHMWVCAWAYMHVHTCTHGCGYTRVCVHVCECVHAYTCTRVLSVCLGMGDHTCTHTDTGLQPHWNASSRKQSLLSPVASSGPQLHPEGLWENVPSLPEVLCHPRKAGPHGDVPERLSGEGVLLKHKQKTSLAHLIPPPGPPPTGLKAQQPVVLMGNRHLLWGPLPGNLQLLWTTTRNLGLGIPYLLQTRSTPCKEEHQIPLPLQQHPLSPSLRSPHPFPRKQRSPQMFCVSRRIRPASGSTRPAHPPREESHQHSFRQAVCAVPCFLSPSRVFKMLRGMCPVLGLSSSRGSTSPPDLP